MPKSSTVSDSLCTNTNKMYGHVHTFYNFFPFHLNHDIGWNKMRVFFLFMLVAYVYLLDRLIKKVALCPILSGSCKDLFDMLFVISFYTAGNHRVSTLNQ